MKTTFQTTNKRNRLAIPLAPIHQIFPKTILQEINDSIAISVNLATNPLKITVLRSIP